MHRMIPKWLGPQVLTTLVILLSILITIYVSYSKYFARSTMYSNQTSDRNVNSKFGITYRPTAERDLRDICSDIDTNDAYSMTSLISTRIYLDTHHESKSTSVYVFIDTFDQKHRSKSIGHDVIVVWAQQINGDGRVSGHVVDNANGSYAGIFKTFWTGHTLIYAKLLSPIENTCLRLKALQKYGTIAFTLKEPHGIRAIFTNNSFQESTQCGPNTFIYSSNKICNYTFLNDGMPFFCGQPISKQFRCSHLNSFSQGPFKYKYVSPADKIQNPGHGVFRKYLSLDIPAKSGRNTTIQCKSRSALLSWTEPVPKAFWLNGIWNFVNCYSRLKYKITEYRSCLRNKTLVFFGDSTIGQYVKYFVTEVLNRNMATQHDNIKYETNKIVMYQNHGINLIFMRHEMPFHYNYVNIHNIISVPHKIDLMRTDRTVIESSVILIGHYNSHFTAYPPSEYSERIKHLVDAIARFLEAKPSTKVLFKGPHVVNKANKWFDPHISLLFKKIVETEFEEIMDKVIYLDTWDIAVAHNSEVLHPEGNAFTSQIQQLMTYIC